jgi:hypothetical protein
MIKALSPGVDSHYLQALRMKCEFIEILRDFPKSGLWVCCFCVELRLVKKVCLDFFRKYFEIKLEQGLPSYQFIYYELLSPKDVRN